MWLDHSSPNISVLLCLCRGPWDYIELTPPKPLRREFSLLSMVWVLGQLFAFFMYLWFRVILNTRFLSRITTQLWKVAKLLRKLRPKRQEQDLIPKFRAPSLPTMGVLFSSLPQQDPLFSGYNRSEINSSCEAPAFPPPGPGTEHARSLKLVQRVLTILKRQSWWRCGQKFTL